MVTLKLGRNCTTFSSHVAICHCRNSPGFAGLSVCALLRRRLRPPPGPPLMNTAAVAALRLMEEKEEGEAVFCISVGPMVACCSFKAGLKVEERALVHFHQGDEKYCFPFEASAY